MMGRMKKVCLPIAGGLPLLLAGGCFAQPDHGSQSGQVQLAGHTCPTEGPPAFVIRAMTMLPGAPRVTLASSVAPSDTSTSVVIAPDPKDQIHCGAQPLRKTRNIVFSTPRLTDGSQKPLKLDVLAPADGGAHPLIVYIAGGGFVIAIKESAADLRTYMAEQGFVVATVEYRVAGDKATYVDGVADVKSAIRYLRAHAREYGIDPTRVAVWGQSAGGYLAVMTGVTNGEKGFDRGDNLDQSSSVQAVIDEFGTSDMSKIAADFDAKTLQTYRDPKNPVERYINGPDSTIDLLDDPIAKTKANPISHISSSTPPYLIFSGSNDRIISPSQTLLLHDALTAAGVKNTRYILTGAGHGDMSFMGDAKSGLPWSTNQVMGIMVGFLKSTFASPSK